MRFTIVFVAASALFAQAWVAQQSGTTASLRGVSAVGPSVVWASGIGRDLYTDAGWRGHVACRPWYPDAADLDFRAVHALDATNCVAAEQRDRARSRGSIRRPMAGRSGRCFTPIPMRAAFSTRWRFGMRATEWCWATRWAGSSSILVTGDGGVTWQSAPSFRRPWRTKARLRRVTRVWRCAAIGKSGSARADLRAGAWFIQVTAACSGPSRERLCATTARGLGIFSLAWADGRHGVAVGGDYGKPAEIAGNVAVTSDGGRTLGGPRRPRIPMATVPRWRI